MTTVEHELLNLDKASDRGRQSDDLGAFLSRHSVKRRKFLLAGGNGLFDPVAEKEPRAAMNVLQFSVENGSAWLATCLWFRDTSACGAWSRRSDWRIG